MRSRFARGAALVLLLLLAAALWFAHRTESATAATASAAQPQAAPAPGPTPGRAVTPPAPPTPSRTGAGTPASLDDAGTTGRADTPSGATDAGAREAAGATLRTWLRANAGAAEHFVDEYCEQSRKVAALGAYADHPRTRDAAVYLGVRVDWENGRVGLLHLPESLTQRMSNPPEAWRHMTPADYAGLDFSWMRELLAYDTWSLSADGPLHDTDKPVFWTAPLPNYVGLQRWVKLRLLKGLQENDLPQASVEVEHLARLCGTTSTLIGEMIRLRMYRIEYEFYESVGLPPPAGLPTADDAFRLRNLGFASPGFLLPGVPREVQQKALACTPMRCAMLLEALGVTAELSQVMPDAEAQVQWLLSQEPCDQNLARLLSHGTGASPEEVERLSGLVGGVGPAMTRLLDGGG